MPQPGNAAAFDPVISVYTRAQGKRCERPT